MEKAISSIIILLIIAFSLSGCLNKDTNEPTIDIDHEASERAKESAIESFKEQYLAIEIPSDDQKNMFTAEILDTYKGKNIYTRIPRICDVFYSEDGTMLMYVQYWSDEKYLLKITPEQFSKIKTLDNDKDFSLHIIYRLEDIQSMFPRISADFYFDISAYDVDSDEEAFVSFDARVIQGTLIDITEIE